MTQIKLFLDILFQKIYFMFLQNFKSTVALMTILYLLLVSCYTQPGSYKDCRRRMFFEHLTAILLTEKSDLSQEEKNNLLMIGVSTLEEDLKTCGEPAPYE